MSIDADCDPRLDEAPKETVLSGDLKSLCAKCGTLVAAIIVFFLFVFPNLPLNSKLETVALVVSEIVAATAALSAVAWAQRCLRAPEGAMIEDLKLCNAGLFGGVAFAVIGLLLALALHVPSSHIT